MSGGFGQVRPPGANVPGYLLPASIAVTILCCSTIGVIPGIVAIVFSAQARSRSQAGNYAGASQAVRKANIWLVVAIVLGLISVIVYFSLGLFGLVLGSNGVDQYSVD